MHLTRIIGFAIMLFGIAVLVFGILATAEFGEKVVQEFTGHYTDKTMWYILGGVAAILVGAVISRSRK